ncbi:MAG: AraC family transcriptional regulator [bacterium]
MDPLSDVLRAVRLDGAFFYLVEATHPWSVHAAPAVDLVPRVLPGAEHLISYHIVTEGECWGGCIDEPQFHLRAGDAIVFPHGDPHFMSSVEGRRVEPGVWGMAPERYLETVHLGPNAGAGVSFVCGFLGCDLRPYNPLLKGMPRVLHITGATNAWLSEFPRQVVAESKLRRPGGASLLTRMAELMFVEIVRRYIESSPTHHAGWLAGLRDPVVGPVLALLHEDPARAWTLAELAREAATSRTVLAERFSDVVGVPPMQYLAQWRLQLAAEQLANGAEKVAAIGARVGYESEAAFSRAFKRATGDSPAAWRRAKVARSH